MYYSNQNSNYMQDLNFYNQVNPNMQNPNNFNQFGMPNQFNNNIQYNPIQTQSFPNNTTGMPINQLMQMNNNLENMYPCTYRIISPVVERVVDGTVSRNQMVDETNLNNMVDTVFNIVEGQLERDDPPAQTTSDSRNNTNNSMSSQTRNSNERNINNDINTQSNRNDRSNSLIKDIIRILLIRSLLSRNNSRINSFSNIPNTNFGMMRTNFL